MIESTVVEMARQTNLINLVGNSIELRRESAQEWSGPCPVCQGNDRLHVKADGFFCRRCHPEFGDAIEYMRWLHKDTFTGAVERLTGHTATSTITKLQPTAKQPAQPVQPPVWHAKALVMVTEAQERIEAATTYLEGRRIDLSTALAFGLGYRHDAPLPATWDAKTKQHTAEPQSAIVIPWYRAGKMVAVRYRFLTTHRYTDTDGKQRTAKLTSVPGSDFSALLYGGHMLPAFVTMPLDANGKCAEQLRTLIIIEGEINAMSVWQVANGWNWDVLSLGSESQPLPAGGRALAERYGRTIIWMDKPEIAKALMAQVPGSVAVNSPPVDGKILDANDLLQSGQLASFLREVRLRACKSDEERERVKWSIN
jgi:hypothetical protein